MSTTCVVGTQEEMVVSNNVCQAGINAYNETLGSPYTRYAAVFRAMYKHWSSELCVPEKMELDKDFGDVETLLNSREWLEQAVSEKGAKRVGGGVGCGQADIDVELEGHRFNISIRPI